jgi:hypothetical protein
MSTLDHSGNQEEMNPIPALPERLVPRAPIDLKATLTTRRPETIGPMGAPIAIAWSSQLAYRCGARRLWHQNRGGVLGSVPGQEGDVTWMMAQGTSQARRGFYPG